MDEEVVDAVFTIDGGVAGAVVLVGGGFEDQRAAPFGQVLALLVEIGAGDFFGAADDDFVVAARAAAAEVPGDEENPCLLYTSPSPRD